MTVNTFQLVDWRTEDAGLEDVDARPWSIRTKSGRRGLTIEALCPDGSLREVWIEVGEGNLVVHCYDPEHDEPLNVRIGKAGIVTDDDRLGKGVTHD